MKTRFAFSNIGPGTVLWVLSFAAAGIARADWMPPESSVTPPAVLTLDAFAVPDWNGANPWAALVVGPDGSLYGSTGVGGTSGYGTLFRLAADGTFTKLHDFNTSEGAYPSAGLVAGPDGALYGSTAGGGTNGYGTLFRLETNGAFTTLHNFDGSDGASPSAALAVGSDGALYGSTHGGGTGDNGTLFRLETNGAFTKLHDFGGRGAGAPYAPLAVGPDGALYGSTPDFDGQTQPLWWPPDFPPDPAATLFRLETNGRFTTLHDFNGTDGAGPSAPLVVGPDGALYGSAYYGGTSGYGTLFRLESIGTFTKLHDFNGTDGGYPVAALVVGPDGALYGSTYFGASSDKGTLFRLGTDGAFTKLYDFNGTNGANPFAPLVVGPDGALYGSTPGGGPRGGGILFKLVMDRPPVADASATPALVISPNSVNATVLLDGSRSSDPDGDTLQYLWFPVAPKLSEGGLLVAPKPSEGGSTLNSQSSTPLATGVVATAVLPVGTHTIQLVVNDGMLSATNRVTVEVITTAQAVERLAATVNAEVPKRQALVATLRAALASIDRNNRASAINQLRAFQHKVQTQVAPLDAALAASLMQSAQKILEAIQSDAVGPRGRFTSLVRRSNGSVHLQFSGERAGIYFIEASTNLVNWDRIGVATSLTNGQFRFEDAKASQKWRLFYRVVHP